MMVATDLISKKKSSLRKKYFTGSVFVDSQGKK